MWILEHVNNVKFSVTRNNLADNSDRLFPGHHEDIAVYQTMFYSGWRLSIAAGNTSRHSLAVNFISPSGIVTKTIDSADHVESGLCERFSIIKSLECCQVLWVAFYEIRQLLRVCCYDEKSFVHQRITLFIKRPRFDASMVRHGEPILNACLAAATALSMSA